MTDRKSCCICGSGHPRRKYTLYGKEYLCALCDTSGVRKVKPREPEPEPGSPEAQGGGTTAQATPQDRRGLMTAHVRAKVTWIAWTKCLTVLTGASS
jgi:hypothetical protein